MIEEPLESEVQAIRDSLEPLFTQAEKEQLWFRSRYQGIWLTPNELRENQAEGKFIWGPSNWELRNPEEELARLYKVAVQARNNHDSWERKIDVTFLADKTYK